MHEPATRQQSTARGGIGRGVLLAAAGIGVLTLMDAVVKLLAADFPVLQVSFLRFFFGLLCGSIAVVVLRPGWPSRETIVANSARSLLVIVVSVTFFFALSRLPLAETIALSFLSPFFVVLFGALLLGERVDGRVITGLAAGAVGLGIIVSGKIGAAGYSQAALLGAGSAVVSAIAYALSLVLLRSRATKDPVITIVLFSSLGPTVLLGVPALAVWVRPDASALALFALVGLLGTIGHVLLAKAFSQAEAARLAPIEYTALAWSIVYGFVLFAELPTTVTLGGAALIIAGAVVTSRR